MTQIRAFASMRAVRMAVAFLFALSMLFYVQRILIPYQERDSAAHDRPRGNLSDLYPSWLGARELLLHGRDPYSPEITREIQAGFYGRPLEPERPGEPVDQERFAYPLYVVFLFAPTVSLPFPVVQTIFFWLLLLLTTASVVLWVKFLRWRPSLASTIAIALLAVGSLPVVQGLKIQQLSLLVGGLIALSALSQVRGHLFLAGILLAFAMIKPQLVLPVAGWLLLWALSGWRERKAYVLGFGLTMTLLLAAAEWLRPVWITGFLDMADAYLAYSGSGRSLLGILITPLAGRVVTLLITAIVVVLCWRFRRVASSEEAFIQVTCLVLTVTVIVIPVITLYNQVLLLPGLLLVARQFPQLWNGSRIARAFVFGSCVVIGWPWLAAIALTILSVFVPRPQVEEWWAVPLYSSLLIPLCVLILQVVSAGHRRSLRVSLS